MWESTFQLYSIVSFYQKKEILLKFRFTLAGPIQLLANHETGLLEKKIRPLQKGRISLNIHK